MNRNATTLRAQLTMVSGNRKTGAIPVSGTSSNTCPNACALKGAGCYAEQHWTGKHWEKIDSGARGYDWDTFCSKVATIKPGQLWRHNQLGDLPGEADAIDSAALNQLVTAQAGRRGFTYTHKPVTRKAAERAGVSRETMMSNRRAIAEANDAGFTVNVSCDTLADVDAAASAAWPTVCVLPVGAPLVSYTPGGRKVVKCPAQSKPATDKRPDGVTCETCGLCQKSDRSYTIGFEAHGSYAKKISGRVSLTVVK
jgi:hypothetical protein